MNNTGGALSFEALIGTGYFDKSMNQMDQRVQRFVKNADKEVSTLDSTFARLGQVAAGAFTVGALSQLPGQIVKVRGEFQQLDIAFTTMLKSKAASDKLMAEVVQLAASTPFGLKEAAQATKQLLAYGSTATEVVSELRMLGDVAAGVSAPIGDLAYLYGTLRTQGRAFTVDIRQFAGRGIPIYEELGKVLGVATNQVSKFVEEGKVGFEQVQQAFKNMSGSGGAFENLMAKQSASLTGLTSQFSDAVDIMFNKIGEQTEGFAAGAISSATSIVENYEPVLKVLTVLVATYGAYKAAIMTVNAMRVVEATTNGVIAASTLKEVEVTARLIAVKVKRAQSSAAAAKASYDEAFAQSLSAAATVKALRIEVSAAASKRASAIESAKAAAAEIAAAEARLGAAQINQAATAQNLSASVRNSAAKELEIAQNAVLIASENGVSARKAASAASTDFLAKKTALETATKTANNLATVTNTAYTTSNVAAQNASAIASTRLTSLQALQVAVTRQLASAQAAFNATLLANPIVAGTVAIVALAGAMWYLSDSTTAAETAQASFNKILEDQKKAKEDLVATTSELTGIINSETSTNFAQVQAYKSLQALYPKLLGNLDLHTFKLKSTAEAQKLLNGALDQMGIDGTSAEFNKATSEVDRLTKKLNSLKDQQKAAGVGAGGLTVPILDTEKAIEAAKEQAKKFGEQINKNTSDLWSANTPVEEQIKHYEAIKDKLTDQRKNLEDSIIKSQKLGGVVSGLKSLFDQLTLTGLNQQIDVFTKKLDSLESKPADVKNKSYYEKLKETSQTSLDALDASQSGSSKWIALRKQIKDAEKQLDKYSIKEKKVAEKDKVQPFGSLKYWEKISRDAQDIIDKTNPKNISDINKQRSIKLNAELKQGQVKLSQTPIGSLDYWEQVSKNAQEILKNSQNLNSDQINAQKNIILDANKKADEIQKQNAVRTFDEELEEKKKKYELYQLWVDNYSKSAADTQFSSLIQKGDSYASYLDGQIKALEAQRDTAGVGLIGPEQEQLVKLKVEYSEATNSEKPLEAFQKRLDNIRTSASSLTEEIEALKKVQSEFSPTDMSPVGIEKKKATSQQLIEAQSERKKQLKDYLVAVAGSEEQRLEIENRYKDLRLALEERFGEDRSKAYQKSLQLMNEAEQQEFNEQGGMLAVKSKEFKALTKLVQNSTAEQTKIRVDAAKKQLQIILESYGEESDEYRQALQNLRSAEEDHKQKSIRMWGMVSDEVGQLGEILQEMGGSIGEVGGALSGLSGQFGNISQALSTNSDGTTSMNQYAAAIQGVIQIVGTLVSASKKRHEAEKAFALARLGFENDYQLALNTSLGESYKAGDNIFNKDIDAKIKAGVKQYDDAQKSYQDAIAKLDEGRAKKRQKNVVDGKTVGQLAGAGAAAGAVIGGIVGVGVFSVATAAVGAVIGGAIGAISGLFAKKKKDVYGGLMEEYPDLVTKGADGWKSVNVEMARALITNGQVDDKTKEMLETAIAYNEQLEKSKDQIKEGLSELVGGLGDNIRDALVGAFRDGTDAAEAFGKAVGDVIADMTAKLLFTALFQDAFNKLQADMVASYAGGDGIITDDLATFFQENKDKPQQYVEGLQAISDAMDAFGFNNIFGKTGGGTSKDPLKGAIQGMSEETAGLLAGQFNAIRITNADISQSMRASLIHLSAISQNTSYNKNLIFLADVVDELKKLNTGNSARAFGL